MEACAVDILDTREGDFAVAMFRVDEPAIICHFRRAVAPMCWPAFCKTWMVDRDEDEPKSHWFFNPFIRVITMRLLILFLAVIFSLPASADTIGKKVIIDGEKYEFYRPKQTLRIYPPPANACRHRRVFH